jgi:multimeric flavodoxin WrbA
MNILAILGSRNTEGQTARATGALLAGTGSENAEQVFLPKCNLERCRQCDERGWGLCRSEGRCVIDDDFADLVEKIKAADAVVFATPVYFGDLSESMRAFTDRLRRVIRHAQDKRGIQDKIAVGICVAGGGGGGAPACAVSLEKVLRTCGFDLVDLVPVRRQNLDMKERVLEITGQWLATQI